MWPAMQRATKLERRGPVWQAPTGVDFKEKKTNKATLVELEGRHGFNISMLARVKMHVNALSIVLINMRLLPFYSTHDCYMYVRKTKILSLMCWLASYFNASSMTKIEIIGEPAIYVLSAYYYYLLHQLGM